MRRQPIKRPTTCPVCRYYGWAAYQRPVRGHHPACPKVDPANIEGDASVEVPMTSQGILDFASDLHARGTRMNDEVEKQEKTNGPLTSQQFLPSWIDLWDHSPFEANVVPPKGLKSFVNHLRDPLTVINPTGDYERLSRYNKRMQGLWTVGQAKGHHWIEPRPPDTIPGKSTSPGTDLGNLGKGLGDVATVALAIAIIWLVSQKR